MSGSERETVTLVTWTPLWFYWPAYLALARCLDHEEFHKIDLEFCVTEPTDRDIRNRFYDMVRNEYKALAICEPSEFTILGRVPEAAGKSILHPEFLVRRIPIVWRLPHWLYWKDGGSPIETMATLPSNSTSGDYIRRVVQALPAFKGTRVKFEDINGSLQHERKVLDDLAASGNYCLASYTPWHLVRPGDGLVRRALPGPKKEVTSLLYVGDQGGTVSRFSESFCNELKTILIEMADTHGDPELMARFIDWNQKKVDAIFRLPGLDQTESHWDPKELAPALAEYILLGCYFPYSSIEAAISAEIRRHVDRRLKEMSLVVLDKVHADIRTFLGAGVLWRDLSFDDRVSIWDNLKQEEDQVSLWTIWTHLDADKRDDEALRLLYGKIVPVGRHRGHVQLKSLVPNLPPTCPFRNGFSQGGSDEDEAWSPDPDFKKCQTQNSAGSAAKQALGDPETDADACALCILSGEQNTLVRSAARRLRRYADQANKLHCEIGHEVGTFEGEARTYSNACPVTVWDVDLMLRAFAAEGSRKATPGDGPACKTVLFNAYQEDAGGDVIFAIYWRGQVDHGQSKGHGTASAALREMAKTSAAAGRALPWAGFWNKTGVQSKLSPADPRAIETSPFFTQAYEQFRGSEYNFAYVAVFSPGPSKVSAS
jgi:hypothetical protein